MQQQQQAGCCWERQRTRAASHRTPTSGKQQTSKSSTIPFMTIQPMAAATEEGHMTHKDWSVDNLHRRYMFRTRFGKHEKPLWCINLQLTAPELSGRGSKHKSRFHHGTSIPAGLDSRLLIFARLHTAYYVLCGTIYYTLHECCVEQLVPDV